MRFLLMTEETIAADMAGAVEQAKDTMGSRFQEIFGSLPSKAVFFGLKALVALLMFLVGRKLIHLCVKLIDKSMERGGTELTVKKFVKMLVKAAGYILLVLLILAVVGVQPTAFATVASSVTVALGLALQGSLGNFAGGLLILILKPFKVGDYIIEDSHKNEGKVKSIGLVYTTLVTLDNRVIVVPNGTLANSSMTNVTAQDKRLLELLVGISYEADMKQAKAILERVMEADPMVLKDEERFAFVSSLDESAVTIGCRMWVKTGEYWKCRWRMTEAIKEALDDAGIEIPYGQVDVHIRNS